MSYVAAQGQLDLFRVAGSSDAEGLAFLSTCPWLDGRYSNKLWRHSFHAISSYPSKLRPQIAAFFIEYLSKVRQVVLDPMAGSGTVPLQACLTGRKGIGLDLSPYAFLLIRVKVQPPSLPSVLGRINEIETKIRPSRAFAVPPQIKEFFHARTLREILAVRSSLRDEDPTDRVILALLCGILHGGRPGFLSRRSRDIIPIRPAGPYEYRPVLPRLRAKALRVYSHGFPEWFRPGEAHLGDCRDADALPEACADLVVTSPPFFEHTEFVRHNWLRLWLVGWELEEQKKQAAEFIGEKTANLPRFRADVGQLMSNIGYWLKPGGYCVVHGGKKRTGEDMSRIVIESVREKDFAFVGLIDEKVDHTRKHAIRKVSGESHNFVVIRKLP